MSSRKTFMGIEMENERYKMGIRGNRGIIKQVYS